MKRTLLPTSSSNLMIPIAVSNDTIESGSNSKQSRLIAPLPVVDTFHLLPHNNNMTTATTTFVREKLTKGKQKIPIEFINDRPRRHSTFCKRKAGMMKKAVELAALTGAEVLVVIASETNHVYTYATERLRGIIDLDCGKELIKTCLSSKSNTNDDDKSHPMETSDSKTGGDDQLEMNDDNSDVLCIPDENTMLSATDEDQCDSPSYLSFSLREQPKEDLTNQAIPSPLLVSSKSLPETSEGSPTHPASIDPKIAAQFISLFNSIQTPPNSLSSFVNPPLNLSPAMWNVVLPTAPNPAPNDEIVSNSAEVNQQSNLISVFLDSTPNVSNQSCDSLSINANSPNR